MDRVLFAWSATVAGVTAGLIGSAAMAQSELCGAYPVGEPSYACTCTPDAAVGSVWGSGPYTSDSNLCTAAYHAGVIGLDGGKVLALATGPQESFTGSDGNGVISRDWGSYPNSFMFDMPVSAAAAAGDLCGPFPEGVDVYTCACDAEMTGMGFAWGSGPYSADSDICTAALHAGVIFAEGGMVTALRTAGLMAYRGSEFNGVSTGDWSEYPSSFVFDLNQ
jgi:hypothetical protein